MADVGLVGNKIEFSFFSPFSKSRNRGEKPSKKGFCSSKDLSLKTLSNSRPPASNEAINISIKTWILLVIFSKCGFFILQ